MPNVAFGLAGWHCPLPHSLMRSTRVATSHIIPKVGCIVMGIIAFWVHVNKAVAGNHSTEPAKSRKAACKV